MNSVEESLGHLETQLAAQAQCLLRQAAETRAQKKADATPPHCPQCQGAFPGLRAGGSGASRCVSARSRCGLIREAG